MSDHVGFDFIKPLIDTDEILIVPTQTLKDLIKTTVNVYPEVLKQFF